MRPTLGIPSPTVQRSLREYTANGYTFYMVQVQKGRFLMGDDNSEYKNEKPAHWVDIAQDFELGQYLVTQALWEAVMGGRWPHLRFQGKGRPIECVSWSDIREKGGFLDRLNALPAIKVLNEQDGCCFALPTEAQWEYAARGGRYGAAFPYEYAGSKYLPEVGWYDDNSQQETQSVGRKLPNLLGLHDMTGNVLEWCEDVWHNNYKGAPKDGSAWNVGKYETSRVVRGGSLSDDVIGGRITTRYGVSDYRREGDIGFRLARYRVTLSYAEPVFI